MRKIFRQQNREYNSRCRSSYQHTSGFTLIETMVAITVLLLAIVGPMTIASKGLQSAFFAKEQFTALYLAQEAVEIARYTRDNNALEDPSGDWLDGLRGSCDEATGCGVDTRSSNMATFINCGGVNSSNCRVNYDSATLDNSRGVYTHDSATPSQFIRRMYVEETVVGAEAEVVVTVTWQTGLLAGGSKVVTLRSNIFNQYAP